MLQQTTKMSHNPYSTNNSWLLLNAEVIKSAAVSAESIVAGTQTCPIIPCAATRDVWQAANLALALAVDEFIASLILSFVYCLSGWTLFNFQFVYFFILLLIFVGSSMVVLTWFSLLLGP